MPRLGLRENWRQFSLLLVVNAFVGAMVGLERAILPLLAEDEFGIASRVAILSFIATFGVTKAIANLVAGRLGDRFGRKPILVTGWLVGLPVPLLLIWAPDWSWIVAANMLLGVNQGLAWSTTVIMKIDLVGPRQRGLAMGLNESAGYIAVSLAALATGYLAGAYGLRPAPFYPGIVLALAGLALSLIPVRETRAFAQTEARMAGLDQSSAMSLVAVLKESSFRNKTLLGAGQAGLVNNLNDGLAWGLFPVYFASLGMPVERIAWLAALYPAVWGMGQLATGGLSDVIGRKPLIVLGMFVQAAAIGLLTISGDLVVVTLSMVALGAGTALVYPTLLAAVADASHPSWRASAVGIYRLWRDAGYVVGALFAGLVADQFGMEAAIGAVAVVTAVSGGIAAGMLREVNFGRTESLTNDPRK